MALGMQYGQFDLSDVESRTAQKAKAVRFLEEFKKREGSYICRDILGCDLSTEEGRSYAINKGLFKKICPKMVKTAAEITAQMLGGDEQQK